jgi:hypothetical protein
MKHRSGDYYAATIPGLQVVPFKQIQKPPDNTYNQAVSSMEIECYNKTKNIIKGDLFQTKV